ncbi:hypothetical protein [Desulfitibacter alkalitolerans]|uniref:hypothetical protein n=1 Tax=Desulfitibacter alkalitolerans TaxID=264641 RepID=UPI000684CE87|nr:hypothetical protein [Desulfitibacter alkalitolerans]
MSEPNINNELERETRLKDFILKNKRLVFLLAILAVVIAAGISVNLWINQANTLAEEDLLPPDSGIIKDQLAEILPKTERTDETEQYSTGSTLIPMDPFMGPMVLLGVVNSGKGECLAIIKAGNTTFVAKEGEQIVDYWTLNEVKRDYAVLISEERQTTLKLSGTSMAKSSTAISGNNISFDFRNADVRDVLSTLAIKLNANLIYTESPTNITLKAENVSPVKALELLSHQLGYGYVQQGKLIVVGSTNKLHSDFFNQMVITRFNLSFVEASIIEPIISKLALPVKSITISTNQQAIWIQGTPQALLKVQELIAAIDKPENAGKAEETISLAYRSIWTNVISPERVIALLGQAGLEVQNSVIIGSRILVFDSDLFSRWQEIEALVRELDNMNAIDYRVFSFSLRNTVAGDAAERLLEFGYGESVKTITFNYPEFGRELLVICPPNLEAQVYSSLVAIDGNRSKVKLPITSATGSNARSELIAKRKLLSELTGISVNEMYISDNISGNSDSPHHVLWIEQTPDNVRLLNNYIKMFDQKIHP